MGKIERETHGTCLCNEKRPVWRGEGPVPEGYVVKHLGAWACVHCWDGKVDPE